MFLVDSETASMEDHQVDGRCFKSCEFLKKTVSNKECKMQMYTTGIFISSNGTSPFLMGETSSNGCFSIAMLVLGV